VDRWSPDVRLSNGKNKITISDANNSHDSAFVTVDADNSDMSSDIRPNFEGSFYVGAAGAVFPQTAALEIPGCFTGSEVELLIVSSPSSQTRASSRSSASSPVSSSVSGDSQADQHNYMIINKLTERGPHASLPKSYHLLSSALICKCARCVLVFPHLEDVK
jgi:hypothetical protein